MCVCVCVCACVCVTGSTRTVYVVQSARYVLIIFMHASMHPSINAGALFLWDPWSMHRCVLNVCRFFACMCLCLYLWAIYAHSHIYKQDKKIKYWIKSEREKEYCKYISKPHVINRAGGRLAEHHGEIVHAGDGGGARHWAWSMEGTQGHRLMRIRINTLFFFCARTA